jgi:hypothetical protein
MNKIFLKFNSVLSIKFKLNFSRKFLQHFESYDVNIQQLIVEREREIQQQNCEEIHFTHQQHAQSSTS